MRMIKAVGLLVGLILLATTLIALQPSTITFQWDYNLATNSGVTGFQLFTLQNDGSHGALLATVPLPSPLPIPGPAGFAVFTAEVIPDRTGRREFVVVVITADPLIFSMDSSIVSKVVRPDPPRNPR